MTPPRAPRPLPPIRRPTPIPRPAAQTATVPQPMERFTFFFRKESVFSNWHIRTIVIDGVAYNCGEQWMMAEKARLFGDTIANRGEESAEYLIMKATAPGVQKAIGRAVRNFHEPTWKENDVRIVKRVLVAKAEQHPDIHEALMATAGTTLVEASQYDRIWGIGLSASDPRARDRRTWLGENKLGFAWTDVREELAMRAAPPAPAP